MKQQAIQYLAFDVHQATSVATVRDASGAIRMRATVPTEAKAIVGLVKGIGPRVLVAFEEGTQAQWLHDVLQPHAEGVVVCNVRGRSETANKSDRIDADWLSEQLRLNGLKSVHHGSAGVATLKQLVRCYMNLVEDATRVMLRVKAIDRGRAVAASGKGVYRPSQRKAWLAKLENRGARARACKPTFARSQRRTERTVPDSCVSAMTGRSSARLIRRCDDLRSRWNTVRHGRDTRASRPEHSASRV